MRRWGNVPFGLRFLAATSACFALLVGFLGLLQLAFWTPVPRRVDHSIRHEVRDRAGHLLRRGYDHAALHFSPAPEGIEAAPVARVFVAAEDHRLFEHRGVDGIAVLRAATSFVRSGRVRSGASTMAMQLARLREGRHPGVHPWHKLRDAVLALRLTREIGPHGVLRAYLDEVPLGPRERGVEAGARATFGKEAASLSLAEAAVVASLARAPSMLARAGTSERVRARLRQRALASLDVLARTGETVTDAKASVAPLVASLVGERPLGVAHAIAARLDCDDRGRSTIDTGLQVVVEAALRVGLNANRSRGVSHGAALLVDLARMEVRAAATLASEGEPWFDGTTVRRQPGSTLKPLLAAFALQELGAEDLVLEDGPFAFDGDDGVFEPRNYDARFHGTVPLEDVVARSLNVPTLRLAARVGTGPLLAFFRRAGLRSLEGTPEQYGVNVALGDGEVTLAELVEAYGAIANDGVARPLRWNVNDAVVERRLVSADVARVVASMLDDDRRRAPSFERDGVFSAPYPLAAKTGTSRDHRDAWALGFTRTMLAAVWLGRADGGATRDVNGARGPGPVVRAILDGTHAPNEAFPRPDPAAWEERTIATTESGGVSSRERRVFRRRGRRPERREGVELPSFVFPARGARFAIDGARPREAQALRVLVRGDTRLPGGLFVREGPLRYPVVANRPVALPLTPGWRRLELVAGTRVVDVRDVVVKLEEGGAPPAP